MVEAERGQSMTYVLEHLREFVSLAVPFIAWILTSYFQGRPRLIRSKRHSFTFLIQEPLRDAQGNVISPTQTVNTASMSVLNAGRTPASKLEIVFNWKPQHLNIWPTRHYVERAMPDGRYSLFFDNLPPKDILGFELLAVNAPLPELVTVTSEHSVAKIRALELQPVYPRWAVFLILWMILSGIAANVYFLSSFIQALARQ